MKLGLLYTPQTSTPARALRGWSLEALQALGWGWLVCGVKGFETPVAHGQGHYEVGVAEVRDRLTRHTQRSGESRPRGLTTAVRCQEQRES